MAVWRFPLFVVLPLAALSSPVFACSGPNPTPLLARFADRLPADGGVQDNWPEIVELASEAFVDARLPEWIRYTDAPQLADVILTCLAQLEQKEYRRELAYLAAIATVRAAHAPAATALEQVSRSQQFIELEASNDLRDVPMNVRRVLAIAVSDAERRLRDVANSSEVADLRRRVDSMLTHMTSPGSAVMDAHIETIAAPVRARLALLVQVALTQETARDLALTYIAKEPGQPDGAAEERNLTEAERQLLAELRRAYAARFGEAATADGVPQRIIAFRTALQQNHGLDILTLDAPCLSTYPNETCDAFVPEAFEEAALYAHIPELLARLVPLQDLDAELRLAAAELAAFLGPFGAARGVNTDDLIASLQQVALSDPLRLPPIAFETALPEMAESAFINAVEVESPLDFCGGTIPTSGTQTEAALAAIRAEADELLAGDARGTSGDLVPLCTRISATVERLSSEENGE